MPSLEFGNAEFKGDHRCDNYRGHNKQVAIGPFQTCVGTPDHDEGRCANVRGSTSPLQVHADWTVYIRNPVITMTRN